MYRKPSVEGLEEVHKVVMTQPLQYRYTPNPSTKIAITHRRIPLVPLQIPSPKGVTRPQMLGKDREGERKWVQIYIYI